MLGGAIFFLREWRPRDGRSKGLLLSFASPLLSRSRPAMPDRMDRGSPKSSSNSSAFMSILFVFCGAARFVVWPAVPCMGTGRRGAAHGRPGCAACLVWGLWDACAARTGLRGPRRFGPGGYSHTSSSRAGRLAHFRLALVLSRRAAAEARRGLLRKAVFPS